MQMVHILDQSVVQSSGDADIVEHRQVLHVFAQSHTACVWADWNLELPRHQQYDEDFVDASEPAAIDLAKVDGSCLHELLENHTVLAMLARHHTNRVNGSSDGRVPQYIVRTSSERPR